MKTLKTEPLAAAMISRLRPGESVFGSGNCQEEPIAAKRHNI